VSWKPLVQQGGFLQTHAELFSTHNAVSAYRLPFGIYSGIVRDGIDDLVTADIGWAGGSSLLLFNIKVRIVGGAPTASSLSGRAPSWNVP
jgi:hypothetical protein